MIAEPVWLPSSYLPGYAESYALMMETVTENLVKECSLPGLTVHLELHIAKTDGTAWVASTDANNCRQFNGREPSRMASMTKTYTAAPIPYNSTVQQLTQHISGLPEYNEAEYKAKVQRNTQKMDPRRAS